MKNVLEWLEATAARCPDKVAFYGNKQMTFGELLCWAKAIGTKLNERFEELGTSSPVAVFSAREATTPALFAGVVYAGEAYAPIDAALPAARLKKILENLNPSLVLMDAASKDAYEKLSESIFEGQAPEAVVVDFEQSPEAVAKADEQRLAAVREKMVVTDPLYIIYTSGSSGNPKGVMTNHLSLMTYINAYCKVMGITEDDKLGNQSPLDYIAAIRDIYIPYKTGCATVIIPKEYFMDPNDLFSYMNQNQVTSVGWSVSALTVPVSLGAFEEVKLETLNKVCFSGSVMPCSVLRIWQNNLPSCKFVNQYGPTEATASCTYYEVDHLVEDDEVLPIGKPYENYKVFLLDENQQVAERGEICVSGPVLALGYYNDPEGTEKNLVLHPRNKGYPERIYRTGDIGSYDADGNLLFHGRMDRQVKHMGHRVELDEVEYAANTLPEVAESCCIYNKEKEVLILFYTGSVDKRELSLALRKLLPGFMVPRKMICLEEMPKLPNGKIDMKKLEEM